MAKEIKFCPENFKYRTFIYVFRGIYVVLNSFVPFFTSNNLFFRLIFESCIALLKTLIFAYLQEKL